jgi:hypothetical protein
MAVAISRRPPMAAAASSAARSAASRMVWRALRTAGVAVGGEFGRGQGVVVADLVTGAFMGEEGFTLGRSEAARYGGGDDDAVGPPGRAYASGGESTSRR